MSQFKFFAVASLVLWVGLVLQVESHPTRCGNCPHQHRPCQPPTTIPPNDLPVKPEGHCNHYFDVVFEEKWGTKECGCQECPCDGHVAVTEVQVAPTPKTTGTTMYPTPPTAPAWP